MSPRQANESTAPQPYGGLKEEAAQLFSIASALQRAEHEDELTAVALKNEALELLCDSCRPALYLPDSVGLAAAG